MKLPVRIEGYAGEHDEAGARIVDADNKHICSTAHVENTGAPESWYEYFDIAKKNSGRIE
jgi:hypothetical protein